MHLYYGVDPCPHPSVIPTSPAASKGVWPVPIVADDEEEIDAASMMSAIEANTDRSNFLGWRMINIVDGGVYAFTPAVDLSNVWKFRSDVIHYAPLVHSGTLAWQEGRAPVVPALVDGGTLTITPSHGDVWKLNAAVPANTNLILAPLTGVSGVIRFTLHRTYAAGTCGYVRVYDTTNTGAFNLVAFAPTSGFVASGDQICVVIFWDGTKYVVESALHVPLSSTGFGVPVFP
jgi:hypothetical protein